MALPRPFEEDRRALLPRSASLCLSPPVDRWCDVLRFVSAKQVQCLKLLNSSDLPRRRSHVTVALPASLITRSYPLDSGVFRTAQPSKVAVERCRNASLGFQDCTCDGD